MTKKIEVEEVDRLSEFLDPILHHILSFLPFRQVVQTCVLSKRWEKIWHSSPDLEFDRTIFDHCLRLVSCEGFRSLELSGLCKLNVIKLIDNSDLQQVVIITPNVSLLSIVGPNRPLEIHHSFSKNLKRLSLSSIPVCNKWLHDQIFKLPELEYLKLHDYPLNSLKLSSPSLKTLLILECTYLVEISIVTPNLQLFDPCR
ncbi:hypothetical protein LWI28_024319 [Acer negundo]|uniref:F-box domain-containing protein n=1 Tax=Acer negundo TaxID=4023 RepID=A0AAD5IW99_ACENE|nr:hypothetical protein LWI28_024319 [Acer negundo]